MQLGHGSVYIFAISTEYCVACAPLLISAFIRSAATLSFPLGCETERLSEV